MAPTWPSSNQSPHPLDLRSLLSPPQPQEHHLLPTRSYNPISLASLFRRQVVTITASSSPVQNPIIPAYYATLNNSPQPPGVVAGIVFGAVGGFLLLLWLIYTCVTFGQNTWGRSSVVDEDITVRRRSDRSRSSRHSRHTSRTRSETIEVERRRSASRSRTRSPPRSRRETVIIEETTRRAPREEERIDDVVEVFEEHSPVRRESTRRSRNISEGFRTVDPEAFGGGDRPMRKVSRRG